MQVRLIQSLSFDRGKTISVKEFVGEALEGDVYDSDRMERMSHNCAEALARLCDVLAEKGIISLRDVVYIAKGYKDFDMLEETE